MNNRIKVLAIAAFSFFTSVGGAFAVPVDYDGPTYWEGTRAQLRETCRQINGELIESHGKTRCYSIHRQALFICKDRGLCQTQRWYGPGTGSPSSTGYEDNTYPDYSESLSDGGDGAGDGSEDSGSGDDSGGGTGDIFL